jgi:prephenate dehydrogenase
MNIAIIGLGLIGGSLALALHGFRASIIAGYDKDPETTQKALGKGAIDIACFDMASCVAQADLTVFCSSPGSILENMRLMAPHFRPGSLVSDICGLKRDIVQLYGNIGRPDVDYVGFHPMAGKEAGGFENAEIGLFQNAGFIIVPCESSKAESVDLIRELSEHVGAGRIEISGACSHDALIAYTSDLMHVSACALVEEFPPEMNLAYAAGAYRDCTRVASIDADLWTELLMRNADSLLPHIEKLIGSLGLFRESLSSGDWESLRLLLERAAANKAEILRK